MGLMHGTGFVSAYVLFVLMAFVLIFFAFERGRDIKLGGEGRWGRSGRSWGAGKYDRNRWHLEENARKKRGGRPSLHSGD